MRCRRPRIETGRSRTEPFREHIWRPPAEGLYDPSLEKDSCGVGFIANIKGKKSHQIVSDALSILCNLEHRGAVGADPRAGDGAGILVQIPHAFFARKAAEIGFQLPKPGDYAVGALFMPKETAWRKVIKSIIADQIKAEGLMLLGWRDVPTDNSSLGETVKPTEPAHMQVFIGRNGAAKTEDEFERRLYILRKSISQAIYQRRDRGLAGYYPVLAVVPHRDLQGHVPRRPARQVLSRPARAGFRERAGAGASALLDQHLPDLVAGASLPDDRP